MLFQDTKILGTTTYHRDRLYREVIEICKHLHNFNKKEKCQQLSKIWYPVLKKKHVLFTGTNVTTDSQLEARLPSPFQSEPVPVNQADSTHNINLGVIVSKHLLPRCKLCSRKLCHSTSLLQLEMECLAVQAYQLKEVLIHESSCESLLSCMKHYYLKRKELFYKQRFKSKSLLMYYYNNYISLVQRVKLLYERSSNLAQSVQLV